VLTSTARRVLVGVLAAVGLIAAAYVAWLQWAPADAPQAAASVQGLTPMAPAQPPQPPQLTNVKLTAEDQAFIDSLRAKTAPHIHGKHAQIKAIEQLIAYLMAKYPDDWQDRVYDFLKQLYPDLADALYDKFQRLIRYNDWLRDNRAVLLKLSADDRRKAMWDARREAFGADAEEIFAAQRRGEQVQEALNALESAEGMSVDQKLATYLDAIHTAFGEDANYLIQSRQTEVMNSFLSVNSVQDDLHGMSSSEREKALYEIRRGMGMDEAALERWEDLDKQRDKAWDSGQEYMQERERIQSKYEGEEEQRRLQELQEDSFGDEAEIIRNEEAAGFYRYGNRRRYGRE
jgi:hypothetical protein